MGVLEFDGVLAPAIGRNLLGTPCMFPNAAVTASIDEHSLISCNSWRVSSNVVNFRIAADILAFTVLVFRGVESLFLQAIVRKPWLTVYRAHTSPEAA